MNKNTKNVLLYLRRNLSNKVNKNVKICIYKSLLLPILTCNFKLNFEKLLFRVNLLPLSMYLQLSSLLFFLSLLEQKFCLSTIPVQRHADKRKKSILQPQKELLPPNEPDCQFYRKWSEFVRSDWCKNPNFNAYEKQSKQLLRAKRVFLVTGMWLPAVPTSVIKILIHQQWEIPSGQPENPQQQQQCRVKTMNEVRRSSHGIYENFFICEGCSLPVRAIIAQLIRL